jgi:APA family basic amino acid/polyamine antiporter
MSSVWRKKPISAFHAEAGKSELKRILTKWGLTSLGIGAIIGGGIFTLTGIAAHDHAGPALALSFVIAGIGCLFASLCYAEFASVLPVEGSAYAYAYGTVGELFAWFIGWNLILEYMMGATTVAVAWSGYFSKLLHMFGLHIPDWLNNDPITYGGFAFNLPAFLITWLVTGILIKGIKEAASTNNLIVVLKVAVVLFVIIAGAFYVNPENWTPFIPAET